MNKLTKIKSKSVVLKTKDVDTDQIIPARFLKSVSRDGFGENLFRDWRYDSSGNLKKDFVLKIVLLVGPENITNVTFVVNGGFLQRKL